MQSYKKQERLAEAHLHLNKMSAEIISRIRATLSILSSVLGVGITVFAALVGKLLTGNVIAERPQINIWIPIAMGLAVAVVVMIFAFLLKREPSKVLHLRQRLTDIYLSRLTESIKKSDGVIRA